MSFRRSYIRAGDTTTVGGSVPPTPQKKGVIIYHGALASFEGDPVWCPVCESFGISKCVQPFRPDTGHDSRQKLLDGDLCVCKCSPPPRLVAKHHNVTAGFEVGEINKRGMSCAGWVEHAGLQAQFPLDRMIVCGKLFRFVDKETGLPLANRTFVVNDRGFLREAQTDSDGVANIEAPLSMKIKIHLNFSSSVGEMKYQVTEND